MAARACAADSNALAQPTSNLHHDDSRPLVLLAMFIRAALGAPEPPPSSCNSAILTEAEADAVVNAFDIERDERAAAYFARLAVEPWAKLAAFVRCAVNVSGAAATSSGGSAVGDLISTGGASVIAQSFDETDGATCNAAHPRGNATGAVGAAAALTVRQPSTLPRGAGAAHPVSWLVAQPQWAAPRPGVSV